MQAPTGNSCKNNIGLDIDPEKWQWNLCEPGILDPLFKKYQFIPKKHIIKSNPGRKVFRCGNYYIKLDTPGNLFHKIRSLIRPKAEIEFETARQLERQSVPVVRHLAWARQGSSSLLVTQAFTHGTTVEDHAFHAFIQRNQDCTEFLRQFAAFFTMLLQGGCYHKDFHPGNILWRQKDHTFALIDLYEIRFKRVSQLTTREKIEMCQILATFKNFISDSQAADFIVNISLEKTQESAMHLWWQLLRQEAARIMNKWPRRRQQILHEYAKYVTVIPDNKGRYLFRNRPTLMPVIKPELPLEHLPVQFTERKLPFEMAQELWLRSFLMDFLGIRHNMPLIWHQPVSDIETSLYFPVRKLHKPGMRQQHSFINRARIAGVDLAASDSFGLTENNQVIALSLLENVMN